ncbi:MAG: helix-turn-helix transcriptional regulator [Lentisphaerae bacterium]|nr:helix-turn-helix transcriptional regulator [Lentisphaerota bacterium]
MNLLELSQNIRKVRIEQDMTVEQLAKASGFSKGFISQVENFRITPSLKALTRIADALGVSMSALFAEDGDTSSQYTFGNLSDGRELDRDNSEEHGIRYFSLAHRHIGRKMDPFVIEYTPAAPREFKFHDTEEFFILLEGELNYIICDNNTCKLLRPNDTIYLKANVPHRVELAPGCTFAKGLLIYTDSELTID